MCNNAGRVPSLVSTSVPAASPPSKTGEWSTANKWGLGLTIAGTAVLIIGGAALTVYAAGKIPQGYQFATKIGGIVLGASGLTGTITGIFLMRKKSEKTQETPAAPSRLQPVVDINRAGGSPLASSSPSSAPFNSVPKGPSAPSSSSAPKGPTVPLSDKYKELITNDYDLNVKSSPVPMDLRPDSPLNRSCPFLDPVHAPALKDVQDFRTSNLRFFLDTTQAMFREVCPTPESFAMTRSRVVARIDQLQQEIGFIDRLKSIHPSQRLLITLQDLEAPWRESGLMILLMPKEQRYALTLEQIGRLSPRQFELLKKFEWPAAQPISHDRYEGSLTLGQLQSCSPRAINAALREQKINTHALAYLTFQQVEGLDTSLLDQVQFLAIFSVSESSAITPTTLLHPRTLFLGINQVYALQSKLHPVCFGLCLKFLKQDVLAKFDFVAHPIDQATFDAFVPIQALCDMNFRNSLLNNLRIEQVYDLLNLRLFDSSRMALLPHHIVKAFDFVNYPLTDDLLRGLFFFTDVREADAIMRKRFAELDNETQLYPLIPRLDGYTLRMIPESKFRSIDFSVCDLRKDQVDAMIPIDNIESLNIRTPWIYCRMSWLEPDQLRVLAVMEDRGQRVLDGAHLFFLAPEKVPELNLESLTDGQFKALFVMNRNPYVREITILRLQSLDVVRDILPNWRRWEGLFAYFKPSQVEKIDFSTHPMNQRMFDARYPKPDTSKRDWYRNNPIQELSGPQIVASQFLFDEERASCISPEQVADMVFSRLTPEPLLKGMFKERCPSQAQYHRLYKVKPEQYAYVEKYLTEGMKQAYTENVLNKK